MVRIGDSTHFCVSQSTLNQLNQLIFILDNNSQLIRHNTYQESFDIKILFNIIVIFS